MLLQGFIDKRFVSNNHHTKAANWKRKMLNFRNIRLRNSTFVEGKSEKNPLLYTFI
jgi:hypothetical protein